MTLKDLKPGDYCVVAGIGQHDPALLSRVMSLGIIPGCKLQLLRRAPLGDPMQVKVGSSLVSIRRADSALIEVDQIAV